MKKILLVFCLATMGCYTATLDIPCNGVSVTATVGGQTALLDALLPLLSKAVGGAVFAASAAPAAPPQMCGHVETTGIDLLGTAVISGSSVVPK